MEPSEDKRLVRDSAARLYDQGQPIWHTRDRWNRHKRASIDRFARRHAVGRLESAKTILDAGAGSEPYAWLPPTTIALDRFSRQVAGRPRGVAEDLERLPFANASINFVVCVASVLNYVSAAEAISELARVTAPNGHMLLHFETSTSFEHFGRTRWNSAVARLETINAGRPDTIWIYSPAYIRTLVEASGFRIRKSGAFHILSALGLRLGIAQQEAAIAGRLDTVLAPLSRFADDVILLAERL